MGKQQGPPRPNPLLPEDTLFYISFLSGAHRENRLGWHLGQCPVRGERPQDRLSDALFRGEVGEIIDYALRLAVDFLLR